MYGSLFWIEWLDRLDRVLSDTHEDVAALRRAVSPRALAAIERSGRQLAALTNDLRLLDRGVLPPGSEGTAGNPVDNLQKALDSTLFHLGSLLDMLAAGAGAGAAPDRMLAAINSALRETAYEAALLVEPEKRRA